MLAHAGPVEAVPGSYIAVLLVAVATLVGAWLGRRPGHRAHLLSAAAGVLLAVGAVHLLPAAIGPAGHDGAPLWAVSVLAIGGYAAASPLLRAGCPCEASGAGAGTALAVSTHRAIEGSVLALTGPGVVLAALVVHAAGEGMTLITLLGPGRPARTAGWLSLTSASPAVGVLTLRLAPLPAVASPLLMAVCAGVLLRIAWGAARFAAQDDQFGPFAAATGGFACALTTAAALAQ